MVCNIKKISYKTKSLLTYIENYMGFVLFSLLLLTLIFLGFYHYDLYDNSIGIVRVFLSFNILLIALNTRRVSQNAYFTFIGIAFGFMGGFDLLGLLSRGGMLALEADAANLSAQLWICARAVEGSALLLSGFFISKKVSLGKTSLAYGTAGILCLYLMLVLKTFPACYIEGVGFTLFEKISESIFCGMMLGGLWVTRRSKAGLHPNVYQFLIGAILIAAFSQICFILSGSKYLTAEMMGHALKALSVYLIYKGLVDISLKHPHHTLFYKLDESYKSLRREKYQMAMIIDQLKMEIKVREQIEKHLFENEEKYRMLIEMMPDAVFAHNGSEFIFANKAGLDMLGYENSNEVSGKSIYDVIHPDYHNIIQKGGDAPKGEIPKVAEQKIIKKDGSIAIIESTATKVQYKGENLYIIAVRDITFNKKAEQNEKLLREAVEYEKLRSEFFSNISHEFRTPLNVILGTIQLMELYQRDTESKTYKYMKSIKQNCYRLLKLINNLIDISKIDAGYFQLQLENSDVVSVVENITLSVAEYIENKGIKVIFDTDIEEKVIAVDPEKMERIILNLLSNAIKFTKNKGEIYVNVTGGENSTQISVRDTGIGIPTDKLHIIFDRFRQVNKTLIRNSEGSGIGLSIVKSLVELHGGRVSVRSEYGKGSEFIIEIPDYIMADEAAATIDDAALMNKGEKKNVEIINIEFSDIYS